MGSLLDSLEPVKPSFIDDETEFKHMNDEGREEMVEIKKEVKFRDG